MKQYFLLTLCTIAIAGCTRSQISLKSNPTGAEVFVKAPDNEKYHLLGKTPLVVHNETINKTLKTPGPAVLKISKDGYIDENFLITELHSSSININSQMKFKGHFGDPVLLNGAVDKLFDIQQAIKVKQFDEALSQLNQLEKNFPQLAAIYELRGGVYLFKREYQKALEAYKLAARYNPGNIATLRIQNTLSKRFEKRKPTSSSSSSSGGGNQ